MAYTQDELTKLFQRNLSLQQPPPEPAPAPTPAHHTEIKYSISQHYHHSSHVVPTPPTAAAPPPMDDQTITIILSRHGVDPSTLFPSQIELFRSAGSDQQMRLVELWRISPPNYGGHALTQSMDGTFPDTNFELEEHMAHQRWERTQQEEMERNQRAQMEMDLQASAMENDMDMMSEEEQSNAPLTPIQGGDGRWLFSPPEPYMESGYEQLSQREYEASKQQQHEATRDAASVFGAGVGGYSKATDPVYASMGAIGTSWERKSRLEEEAVRMAMRYGEQDMRRVHGQHQEDEEML